MNRIRDQPLSVQLPSEGGAIQQRSQPDENSISVGNSGYEDNCDNDEDTFTEHTDTGRAVFHFSTGDDDEEEEEEEGEIVEKK